MIHFIVTLILSFIVNFMILALTYAVFVDTSVIGLMRKKWFKILLLIPPMAFVYSVVIVIYGFWFGSYCLFKEIFKDYK